ncbi:MAG TPA: hypothetical protein VE076_02075 [Nitrososphaeraceae archaeon]|nr:hypothetical protein [Nitrososphaeraceae archaeon]
MTQNSDKNKDTHKAMSRINSKRKITKKGVLITVLIAAGIIGASFLVYLIPQ